MCIRDSAGRRRTLNCHAQLLRIMHAPPQAHTSGTHASIGIDDDLVEPLIDMGIEEWAWWACLTEHARSGAVVVYAGNRSGISHVPSSTSGNPHRQAYFQSYRTSATGTPKREGICYPSRMTR